MIKGRKEVKAEELEKSHGGSGKYTVRTLYKKEDFKSNILYVREIILPPHSSVGDHRHEGDEELYYISEGSGKIILDGKEKKVTEGDTILTKSGSTHGLINDSEKPLRFFVVCVKF